MQQPGRQHLLLLSGKGSRMMVGACWALWLSLLWPCCHGRRLAEDRSPIWPQKAGKGLRFLGVAADRGCFLRRLGVGSIAQVTPAAAAECKRTQEDMHAPLRRLFLSFPPLHALSADKGVPGSALLAVMDGPRCSTVATVIGYC